MSELKPPFWHHVACNGSNNYPVGHPGMICNCKGWAIRGAQPCPTCAEKDAEIARLIAALEFERDPCRRAVSKDGRCEHEARATAAEQDALERQSIARELLTKLKAAEQERDTYREAVAARKAEMIEWRQAARTARTELAAAERREAEKDKRIAEIVWSMREAAVGRLVNGKVLEAYADALASPSTPSGESMGLSGDLIVTGQQPSTPSPAPSSTCPPCAQLLAWEAETRTATSTPSPAPSAEEPRYAPCAACVSEIGRVDPACRYCGGTGRCSSGATVDQIVGSTGRLVERLRASRPSPPPRSAPREAGAQPAEEQS
jgi:hypothetical protein